MNTMLSFKRRRAIITTEKISFLRLTREINLPSTIEF